MATFYPVKVEINPASMPATGQMPRWNGSIFELKPIAGNFLKYSQEPSVLTDTNFTLSTTYDVLNFPNLDISYALDNSSYNNCQPAANNTPKADCFVWIGASSSWVKFTYNVNVYGNNDQQVDVRVIYDNGTQNVVNTDTFIVSSAAASTIRNGYGSVIQEVNNGDFMYVEIRVDNTSGTPMVNNYNITCTNINF